MSDTIPASVFADVCTRIVSSDDAALAAMANDGLEQYWHFTYSETASPASNLYAFSQALELYGHFCERWESAHHGPVCVVERVRDRYLMPKIQAFVAMQQAHLSTVPVARASHARIVTALRGAVQSVSACTTDMELDVGLAHFSAELLDAWGEQVKGRAPQGDQTTPHAQQPS